jgi:glycosyltransferase involved in cell wall biosynthesis
MAAPLHVLVYGALDAGICDVYRFGMHQAALAELGVELRGLTNYALRVPADAGDSIDEAFASDGVVFDRGEIDWADVVVFRRFYVTQWSCNECALVSPSQAKLERHHEGTGHMICEPDRLIRPLFTAFERYPELLRGRAVLFETDDDLLNVRAWNGVAQRVARERDMIERMVRRADLVTVSTPTLAKRLRRYNDEIRVLRNAIDPTWYGVAPAGPPLVGDPRLLYYGKPTRMRDYDVCRPAVDALVGRYPEAQRVWLGALDAPAGGPPEPVIAAVDEVGPYVAGPAAFARSLAAARPDIGLAPLVGDSFDQAKSELHWLEYTMAGAATVATRMAGGGPFDVIRDGVDGLLAGSRAEWLAALSSLAGSRTLRDEIAGRARERVLAEYTVDVRAVEWAATYQWAADHAGRAIAGRNHNLGALPIAAIEPEARASLGHRRRVREDDADGHVRLAAARAGRVACWQPSDAVDPLVSVLVPVVDEPIELVRRCLRSVVSGGHTRLEVIVATPADDAGRLAALATSDDRIRVIAVEPPPSLPQAAEAARSSWTGRLLGAALDAAGGAGVAPVSPEAEFEADHVEVLLGVAIEHQLEFVYGQAVVDLGTGSLIVIGAWPPNPDGVLAGGVELFSARLAAVARFDPEAWRDAESPGWAFWRSLLAAGVRIAGIESPVTRLRGPDQDDALAGRSIVPAA